MLHSFLTGGMLLMAALTSAVASPNLSADGLMPRQAAGTLEAVPNASPLTFKYTTAQPSNRNYIGVWSAEDQDAPRTPLLVYRYAPGSDRTIQIPLPDDLPAGKYKAWLISDAGRIIAGPTEAGFGVCVKPGSSTCLDGTVCSGGTPQCTVDAREAKVICCQAGQKAFYGQCYDAPNGDDIDVCLYSQDKNNRGSGQVCNRSQNNYCACLAGVNWSACKCCRATQYLSGSTAQCVNK
ncbi:hypothetical protein NLG97_g4937 [Lecanicillium saksenae]|uniref:Uncharacterized protein n=1 Tax=Lecanicillium saksenae TaxID=468837 RepID=A0ACC1QWD9_9HYPO|nr:hypothetical protein NLG97_g4937 [Lecanicillium saksenae]